MQFVFLAPIAIGLVALFGILLKPPLEAILLVWFTGNLEGSSGRTKSHPAGQLGYVEKSATEIMQWARTWLSPHVFHGTAKPLFYFAQNECVETVSCVELQYEIPRFCVKGPQ